MHKEGPIVVLRHSDEKFLAPDLIQLPLDRGQEALTSAACVPEPRSCGDAGYAG